MTYPNTKGILEKALDGKWDMPEYLRGWNYDVQLMLASLLPEFWKGLGLDNVEALRFHGINLDEGFSKAAFYLEGICGNLESPYSQNK